MSSVPTHYPTRSRTSTKTPLWSSAALKSLYRDRSMEDTTAQPSQSNVAKMRQAFEIQQGQGKEDQRLQTWRTSVTTADDERRDSCLEVSPTRASIRARRQHDGYEDEASSGSESEDEGDEEPEGVMSGAIMPLETVQRSAPSPFTPRRGLPHVTTMDVAASMGLTSVEREAAVVSSSCGSASSEWRRTTKAAGVVAEAHILQRHSRSSSKRSHSSQQRIHKEDSPSLASDRGSPRKPSPSKQEPRSQDGGPAPKSRPRVQSRKSNSANSSDHTPPPSMPKHMPAPFSAEANAPSTTASTRHPQRLPLSALRHLPQKSSSSSRSSRKSQRKKQKKERKKVEYYFDTERGVMVRSGLYDEEYRPRAEGKGRGMDLFRRVWEARVWRRLAELVLW